MMEWTGSDVAESPRDRQPGKSAHPPTADQQVRRDHRHQPLSLLTALQSLLYMLIVSLFLMTFTVQPIRIPSASMEPTLLVGDFLLLDRQSASIPGPVWMPPTGIARGNLIVFHDPVGESTSHLVKRVIGLPGDRIHLHANVVYINGRPLPEPYAIYRSSPADSYRDDFPSLGAMDARIEPNWWIKLRDLDRRGEIQVPPGNYFVLGDNRNESDDSRYWGFVPRNLIVGDPFLIYFSWQPVDPETGRLRPPFARWERILHIVR